MTDVISKPTLWQRLGALRGIHFLILFVVTFFMNGLAQICAMFPILVYTFQHHVKKLPRGFVESYDYGIGGGIAMVIAVLIVSALLCWAYTRLSRTLERRTDSEFAFDSVGQRLALGALLGFTLMTGSITIVWLLGDATIVQGHHFIFSAATIIPVICAPIFEELIMRGVVLRIFEKMFGTWVGLLISSALFGLAHLGNPNATVLAAVSIAIEAGLLLGMAYIATRSLWLPIGLHFGWNFTEGNIWGAPDSGNAIHGIFETTTHGNTLVTGGFFGPEASLITPALCLIATVYLYRIAVARGNWQPFRVALSEPIPA